jgi:hypothetical protein
VKNLIPKANPLMNKIEFIPYEAKNYYPNIAKLPDMLSQHEYHIDRNNMNLIDESIFTHEKLKKDVAKCLSNQKKVLQKAENLDLVTLKEFYASKPLIYEKFVNHLSNHYFATFILNLSQLPKHQETKNLASSSYQVRKTITPLIT